MNDWGISASQAHAGIISKDLVAVHPPVCPECAIEKHTDTNGGIATTTL